jgi:TrmH family RNA methyltransferase
MLHALKARSGREKNHAFAVEGVRVVEEALDGGIDLKFAVVSPTLEDSKRGRALAERLHAVTTVRQVSERDLRALTETDAPQGVIAVARIPSYTLAEQRPQARARVLVLDAVQDPGNLGTLIRSADAFGAACVISLPGTVDYWNSKVVRSAAGATFHLPLINAREDEVWSWLEANQFGIYGADMNGQDARSAETSGRVALIVGNEGSGLRKDTRAHVQHAIAIPMPGRAESLNVAVAAAILLYELSRDKS